MAKSHWLINSNRTEVKRFIKNDKSIDGVFEYMFVDTGEIIDQRIVKVLKTDNEERLAKKILKEEHILYIKVIESLELK